LLLLVCFAGFGRRFVVWLLANTAMHFAMHCIHQHRSSHTNNTFTQHTHPHSILHGPEKGSITPGFWEAQIIWLTVFARLFLYAALWRGCLFGLLRWEFGELLLLRCSGLKASHSLATTRRAIMPTALRLTPQQDSDS